MSDAKQVELDAVDRAHGTAIEQQFSVLRTAAIDKAASHPEVQNALDRFREHLQEARFVREAARKIIEEEA